MELLNQKHKTPIYCPIRRAHVHALPEEEIRQHLISRLVNSLGFPLQNLVVEKALSNMPHLLLETSKLPERRADIVCFAKGIHPQHQLFPLLLIECKAVKLTQKVIQQIVGYNYYLKSYFIAVANKEEVRLGWHDISLNKYQFITHIPRYEELILSVRTPRTIRTPKS